MSNISEYEYAKMLYIKGYLPGPIKCSCGSNHFDIQKFSQNKTNNCCFRCLNNNCRKPHPIVTNSFFSKFSYNSLQVISEIIKCFICKEINAEKTYLYLKQEKQITITKELIMRVYKEIRDVIYRYLRLLYGSESLEEANHIDYYSIDESLFGHRNNKQIWILGAINNRTKDFRLEAVLSRDSETLKDFITTYVPRGSNIVTDSWMGYHFLDYPNSGYIHYSHNHGAGAFGIGMQSTAHIESIWGILKHKIKSTYNVIPSKNIIHFIREAEYKHKLRNKSYDEKISDFFECWKLLIDLKDVEIIKSDFLTDSADEDDLEEEF